MEARASLFQHEQRAIDQNAVMEQRDLQGMGISSKVQTDHADIPSLPLSVACDKNKFLTQAEVADRFRVSVATVIAWRKKGIIGFFQAPGSTKILYPLSAVEAFEQRSYHKSQAEEVVQKKKESPEVPARPKKVWRI